MHDEKEIDIINLTFFDPQGRPAAAYVIRTWFAAEFKDGLYCARNKEDAFAQMAADYAKCCPGKTITNAALLAIDGGIINRKQAV